MADTKITALTALTAADPASDVLPIVDISDTTMAASGTTKKISINNILGASGTATLASATITGDLTVDTSTLKVDSTNNRVGIGTASPSGIFHAANLGTAGTTADNFNGYFSSANRNANLYLLAKNTEGSNFYFGDGDSNTVGGIIYDHTSNYMRFDANGSEQMRLNSTGLGVGRTPAYKLDVSAPNGNGIRYRAEGSNATIYMGDFSGVPAISTGTNSPIIFGIDGGEAMRIDTSRNVGVGVTPTGDRRLEIKSAGTSNTTFAAHFRDSADTLLFHVRSDGYFNSGQGTLSPYNNTTASAANMFVDSSGFVYRSTSSLKYKTDVKDSIHGLADVLKLRSVTYKAKNGDDTVFGGLIAEEVHAAGLTEFVAYAPDKTPDSINYGNMVALLVSAIKELTARVQTLEAR